MLWRTTAEDNVYNKNEGKRKGEKRNRRNTERKRMENEEK
jgi:hypothetical protein